MTSRSIISYLYVSSFLSGVAFALTSTSGYSPAHPTNQLLFKLQPDQFPLRQSYFPGTQNDVSKFDATHSQVQHAQRPFDDLHQKIRGTIHVDELPLITGVPQLRPVETPAVSHQRPVYYPVQFGSAVPYHKDIPCTDSHHASMTNKLIGLSNAIARAPKSDLFTSASQIHQEVCSPPESTPCHPQTEAPCTAPQHNPPCSQPQPSPPCEPQPNQPCHSNKPEQAIVPAPKVATFKNIFSFDPQCIYENRPKEPLFAQTSCIPVSSLHPASQHEYSELFTLCSSTEPASRTCEPTADITPCATKIIEKNCAENQPTKLIPAEKPVVHNPFSTEKCDVKKTPKQNPKYVLHHRQHSPECPCSDCYPEAYAVQKPEAPPVKLIQQAPYVVNQQVPYVVSYHGVYPTLGSVAPGQTVAPDQGQVYPFVPPPITKPIPLITPRRTEVQVHVLPCEDDSDVDHDEVHHEVKCLGCGRCSSNPTYNRYENRYFDEKEWQKDILHDIADKLGCQYEEDENSRFSRRRRPEDDQDDYHYRQRGNDRYSSRKHLRTNRNHYEDEDQNDRWRN